MQVTKITIPAGNEIGKCIAISANFRAHTYNMKQRLAYYRKWEHYYKASPSDLNKQCLDSARIEAQDQARRFDTLASEMPEYSRHPDFIKAKEVYEIIKALA